MRKPGKLPAATAKYDYALEYGTNTLEIHKDAIQAGQRVLILDDLLATGGTAEATAKLARSLGAEIAGLGFVVELDFLKGRDKLKQYDVFSLLPWVASTPFPSSHSWPAQSAATPTMFGVPNSILHGYSSRW